MKEIERKLPLNYIYAAVTEMQSLLHLLDNIRYSIHEFFSC